MWLLEEIQETGEVRFFFLKVMDNETIKNLDRAKGVTQ
jgi:hypothetical protein